jgi:anti-sigma regulatory factor (Ser/Thr protein kinase)
LRELVAMVRWSVEWEALEDIQHFAERYLQRRLPKDSAERARFASLELLENAVRYACAGGEVTYEVYVTPSGFEIRVTNEAVDSRVAILKKRVEQLAEGNVAETYKRALRKLLEPAEPRGSGGLGLLRVRHEANVEVSLEVEGRRVTVIAIGESSYAANTIGGPRKEDTKLRTMAKEKNAKVR